MTSEELVSVQLSSLEDQNVVSAVARFNGFLLHPASRQLIKTIVERGFEDPSLLYSPEEGTPEEITDAPEAEDEIDINETIALHSIRRVLEVSREGMTLNFSDEVWKQIEEDQRYKTAFEKFQSVRNDDPRPEPARQARAAKYRLASAKLLALLEYLETAV